MGRRDGREWAETATLRQLEHEVSPGQTEADESLINAMGRGATMALFGATDATFGEACAAYSKAHRAEVEKELARRRADRAAAGF